MITRRSVQLITLTVVVANGSGSTTFNVLGHIKNVPIVAPANAVYDWEIISPAGYGLTGRSREAGNVTVSQDTPAQGLCTFSITNATTGTYTIELYVEPSA